jgi:hypothetical protein
VVAVAAMLMAPRAGEEASASAAPAGNGPQRQRCPGRRRHHGAAPGGDAADVHGRVRVAAVGERHPRRVHGAQPLSRPPIEDPLVGLADGRRQLHGAPRGAHVVEPQRVCSVRRWRRRSARPPARKAGSPRW